MPLKLHIKTCNLCNNPIEFIIANDENKNKTGCAENSDSNSNLHLCYLCTHDVLDLIELMQLNSNSFCTSELYWQMDEISANEKTIPHHQMQSNRTAMRDLKSKMYAKIFLDK